MGGGDEDSGSGSSSNYSTDGETLLVGIDQETEDDRRKR